MQGKGRGMCQDTYLICEETLGKKFLVEINCGIECFVQRRAGSPLHQHVRETAHVVRGDIRRQAALGCGENEEAATAERIFADGIHSESLRRQSVPNLRDSLDHKPSSQRDPYLARWTFLIKQADVVRCCPSELIGVALFK